MAQKTVSKQQQSVDLSNPSGFVGWIYFASIMLFLLGGLEIISGLVAVFSHTLYVTTSQQLLVLNYAAWGWLHIGLGILLIAASGSLILGKTWARIVAITIAVLSALANIAYLPVYPIWSIIALTIDGFVIYAVAMHSIETKE